ncbi:hypothetical protein [Serratia sp. JSRIV006]|uniref:hypothetical protein n=1 Tax=Serratia sp. JSRIV006 TaxID=2831896 RepID=UPI001CBCF022|nr:hypothetical protein [Serratia sp. JSRIV006]UAN64253.1 hypothetical protein KGP16_06675 [Serratia sp. JSRIV006]
MSVEEQIKYLEHLLRQARHQNAPDPLREFNRQMEELERERIRGQRRPDNWSLYSAGTVQTTNLYSY